MNESLDEVIGMLKEMEKKIDRPFHFTGQDIDKPLEVVENKVTSHLSLTQNMSGKFLRTEEMEAISPVEMLDPNGGLDIPE